MSSSLVVSLGLGTWLEHDGDTWRVVAMDGVGVLLQDRRGRERQVLMEYLVAHPSTSPATAAVRGPEEAVGPALDAAGPLGDLEERVGHVREVLSGYRSGHAELALPGEPRPAYGPGRPLMERYQAKAAEIGIGERTLRRWAAHYGTGGEMALLDERGERRADPLGGVDPRWLAVCREMIGEHTDASTPTKALVLERVTARLAASFGEGVVPPPARTKAYEILAELARGRNTFTGSAKGRRSIAGRPNGAYGRLVATRPGEYLLLDTTPLDVFAMEPVTLRWVRTELTVALDFYSRCVAGVRLTPYTTKAVDAAGVVYDSLRPKVCDPTWAPRPAGPTWESQRPWCSTPTSSARAATRPGFPCWRPRPWWSTTARSMSRRWSLRCAPAWASRSSLPARSPRRTRLAQLTAPCSSGLGENHYWPDSGQTLGAKAGWHVVHYWPAVTVIRGAAWSS